MPVNPKRLRMVRARLNEDEFSHLKKEEEQTGASIRDALTERRLRLSSGTRAECCKEQP